MAARRRTLAPVAAAIVAATACGGDAGSTAADAFPAIATAPTPPRIALAACEPGSGTDYQVGGGAGQMASLDQVPWESLKAGDTVRIFYRPEPYAGKFMISARGTDVAPVRVCGVKGPSGERPTIDGKGATTRPALLPLYGNKDSDRAIHQSRSVILVKHDGSGDPSAFPSHVQIDGLAVRRAHPDYSFVDASGTTTPYDPFGACIWLERGHDVVVADNDISDCSQGVFSRSNDDGDFAVTKNVRIAGNAIANCGVVGEEHMHASYTESQGILFEMNYYGAMRPGALGNALKDRSAGTVVRFNRIDAGAHALDLVEAEDFPTTAMADPAYRATFVYGNQILHDGDLGSAIHYGGDHYGSTPGAIWGEPIFRKGTLYFYSNTLYLQGSTVEVFQLSTTDERAEVYNDVFVFGSSVGIRSMRAGSEIGPPWTAGGIVNLARNWASAGWVDSDGNHPLSGQLLGASNVLSGGSSPLQPRSFIPLPGSALIDAAVTGPAAAEAFRVDFELDANAQPRPRPTDGAAPDLGAVEL